MALTESGGSSFDRLRMRMRSVWGAVPHDLMLSVSTCLRRSEASASRRQEYGVRHEHRSEMRMKISVRTAGNLGKYLPPGSELNRAELEVAEGATPIDVLGQLGMPLDGSYLISVNGTALNKAARPDHKLAENDDLAIMPPLRGG